MVFILVVRGRGFPGKTFMVQLLGFPDYTRAEGSGFLAPGSNWNHWVRLRNLQKRLSSCIEYAHEYCTQKLIAYSYLQKSSEASLFLFPDEFARTHTERSIDRRTDRFLGTICISICNFLVPYIICVSIHVVGFGVSVQPFGDPAKVPMYERGAPG